MIVGSSAAYYFCIVGITPPARINRTNELYYPVL